jgi:hypothetical protein
MLVCASIIAQPTESQGNKNFLSRIMHGNYAGFARSVVAICASGACRFQALAATAGIGCSKACPTPTDRMKAPKRATSTGKGTSRWRRREWAAATGIEIEAAKMVRSATIGSHARNRGRIYHGRFKAYQLTSPHIPGSCCKIRSCGPSCREIHIADRRYSQIARFEGPFRPLPSDTPHSPAPPTPHSKSGTSVRSAVCISPWRAGIRLRQRCDRARRPSGP